MNPVLAYEMLESPDVDFVLETVAQMVKHYGVSLNKGTVRHSHQEAHFTSLKFIQPVKKRELRRFMPRRETVGTMHLPESFPGT